MKKKKEKSCKTCADKGWNPICYEQDEPCKLYIQQKKMRIELWQQLQKTTFHSK